MGATPRPSETPTDQPAIIPPTPTRPKGFSDTDNGVTHADPGLTNPQTPIPNPAGLRSPVRRVKCTTVAELLNTLAAPTGSGTRL
jgi:hypothetical protein